MVIYLLLGPSVLMVGTFGMLTFILCFLIFWTIRQINFMVLFCKTTDHFILWFFIFWTIDQINFMILFCNNINHFIL